jgi:GxxExxY protein
MEFDEMSSRILGAALEVHRELGPGLLESAYEKALAVELQMAGIPYTRQAEIAINYKGVIIECGFRADILIEKLLIVELKSVDKLIPLHEAQLLTYMRLAQVPVGLLLNFNAIRLKDGMKRMVL